MEQLDVLAVDRELRRCSERWIGFRRALKRGETPLGDPFRASRSVCGRATFQQLGELASDPVAPALRRWVYRFTEQRLNQSWLVTIAEQRRQELHSLSEPEQGRFSFREMQLGALRHSALRSEWSAQALKHAATIHQSVAELWARRQEIAVRLSLSSPDAMWAPVGGLYELADEWLRVTEDLWQTKPELPLRSWLEQALATEAEVEWPSRLTPRSMLNLFAESRLLESLELDPGPLPETLAPASTVRALARLGAAFRDAGAPRDQPFSIAHDAFGLERRCYGVLFALLPMNREFLRRRLAASKPASASARRALGVSLLIETRVAALRVLLRRAALRGEKAFKETFEADGYRACRTPLPAHAAGAFIQLHQDDLQRFVGLFLGALRQRELVEAHDEDWFRNPRAIDQLRSEAALPPEFHASEQRLELGRSALFEWLREAVD